MQNSAANNSNCFLTPFYIHHCGLCRQNSSILKHFYLIFLQQFSLIKKSNNRKRDMADCFGFSSYVCLFFGWICGKNAWRKYATQMKSNSNDSGSNCDMDRFNGRTTEFISIAAAATVAGCFPFICAIFRHHVTTFLHHQNVLSSTISRSNTITKQTKINDQEN